MAAFSLPVGRPNTARTAYRMGVGLIVQCLSATCAHQTRIEPRWLVDRGAGDVALDYAARRMRCTRCGGLGAHVEGDL